jgi:hypothetical protein
MPINFAVKLIATVALEAMQMGLQASKHTYGPRLSETSDDDGRLRHAPAALQGRAQVRWPDRLVARPRDRRPHQQGEGGGKQTNQSALWTGGVAFADVRGAVGPIDKVLKIWLDETLAYDATGTGPISYASSLGVDLVGDAHLPRHRGPGGGSGLRRLLRGALRAQQRAGVPRHGMLVFDRMPLDNFGNRPPQISILAVTAADPAYPYQQVDSSTDVSGGGFAVTSGGWMARWDTNGSIAWIDAPTRTELAVSNPASGDGPGAGTVSNAALSKDGTAFYYGTTLFDGFNHLYETPPAGVTTMGPAIGDASHRDPGPCRVFDFSDGTRQIYGGVNWTLGGYYLGEALVTDSQAALDFCLDDNEIVWGLFEPSGSSSNFELRTLTGAAESFTVTGAARAGAGTAYFCYVAPQRHFYVLSDGHWYLIDRDTGAIKDSGTQSYTTRSEWNSGRLQQNPGTQTSFWSAMTEISLEDGSTIRTLTSSNWLVESLSDPAFEPVNNAIVSWNNTGGRHVIGSMPAPRWARCATTRPASLTQPSRAIRGRAATKSQMEPLLDIHDVDARPHDFTSSSCRADRRRRARSDADFAKNGENPRYKHTTKQDTDLPKMLRVNFADTGSTSRRTTSSRRCRPTPSTQRDVVIDLTTCADTPDGAQQKGDRYMRRNGTAGQRSRIADGAGAGARAWRRQDARPRRHHCGTRSSRSRPSSGRAWIARSSATRPIRGSAQLVDDRPRRWGPRPGGDRNPGAGRGFVIDAPYRQDSDADVRPLLYSGAGAYAQLAFPGAAIFEATGAGDSAGLRSAVRDGQQRRDLGTVQRRRWRRAEPVAVGSREHADGHAAERDR